MFDTELILSLQKASSMEEITLLCDSLAQRYVRVYSKVQDVASPAQAHEVAMEILKFCLCILRSQYES